MFLTELKSGLTALFPDTTIGMFIMWQRLKSFYLHTSKSKLFVQWANTLFHLRLNRDRAVFFLLKRLFNSFKFLTGLAVNEIGTQKNKTFCAVKPYSIWTLTSWLFCIHQPNLFLHWLLIETNLYLSYLCFCNPCQLSGENVA